MVESEAKVPNDTWLTPNHKPTKFGFNCGKYNRSFNHSLAGIKDGIWFSRLNVKFQHTSALHFSYFVDIKTWGRPFWEGVHRDRRELWHWTGIGSLPAIENPALFQCCTLIWNTNRMMRIITGPSEQGGFCPLPLPGCPNWCIPGYTSNFKKLPSAAYSTHHHASHGPLGV